MGEFVAATDLRSPTSGEELLALIVRVLFDEEAERLGAAPTDRQGHPRFLHPQEIWSRFGRMHAAWSEAGGAVGAQRRLDDLLETERRMFVRELGKWRQFALAVSAEFVSDHHATDDRERVLELVRDHMGVWREAAQDRESLHAALSAPAQVLAPSMTVTVSAGSELHAAEALLEALTEIADLPGADRSVPASTVATLARRALDELRAAMGVDGA